ncbi:hypothetical protein PIB30_093074 [Stylosanthes scabra]|uniref:Uncharacterized protein n=1 Tax=Stylosanthes scabra TaxID=79078 RepID=A0ABU6RVK5_9FABA|nr:hypothetical protein [Stylosanthes scabra]
MHNDASSTSMHTTNGNNSTLMPMAQSHTIKGKCHLRVALLAPPVHSSGEETQEPSSPLPRITSPVAPSRKDTRDQAAK